MVRSSNRVHKNMSFQPIVSKVSHIQWSLKPQDMLLGLAMAIGHSKPVAHHDIFMTASGFRDSMMRLKAAKIVCEFDGQKHVVMPALRSLVLFAAPFCWPAVIGQTTSGYRTAFTGDISCHSHNENLYVWPDESGEYVGTSILPLHTAALKAAIGNPLLGRVLNLFDVLRVESGALRDMAIHEIQNLLASK